MLVEPLIANPIQSMRGIREGVQIGFKGVSSTRKNMHSAVENPEVVSAYLAEEKKGGILLQPYKQGVMTAWKWKYMISMQSH